MGTENQEISQALWTEEADEEIRYGKGFHWVESPRVSEYMNVHISGDPSVNWVQYTVEKYLQQSRSPVILSLGCGGGALERHLLRLKPEAAVIGLDFAAGAIELARTRAKRDNLSIEYRIADMNAIRLERSTFDFVFASSALHHVDRLEHLLSEVESSLKNGGFLIANEYTGPNRLQWRSEQVAIINEILAILPDRFRRRVTNPAEYKLKFHGPVPVDQMAAQDPSEAPRSEDILDLIRERFHVVEVKPFGGTILHMLLQDIVGNFRPDDPEANCILNLICYLESKLIAAGALRSDFTYFVASRKTST